SAGRFGRSRRHLRGSVGYGRGFRGSVRWRRGLRLPQLFRSRCEGGVLFGHELGESKRGALLVAFVGPVHRLSSRLSGWLVRGGGMPRTFDYRGGFRFGVGGRVRGGRLLGHLERLARNIFEQLFGFQLDWLRFDPLFSGERSLRHVGLGEYVFQPNCRSIRRGFGTDGRRGLTFGGAGGRRAERSGAGRGERGEECRDFLVARVELENLAVPAHCAHVVAGVSGYVAQVPEGDDVLRIETERLLEDSGGFLGLSRIVQRLAVHDIAAHVIRLLREVGPAEFDREIGVSGLTILVGQRREVALWVLVELVF